MAVSRPAGTMLGMSPPASPFTRVPRWTRDPVAGVVEHEATIPDDLAAALHRVADELGVPVSSVLLAAHAKVVAALSGEREVVTGCVAGEGGSTLPCRLSTGPDSWRALLLEAHRVEAELLSHGHVPVDDPGLTQPHLGVRIAQADGRLVARLRYRTDVLDSDAAARIAGYHLTALARIAADPDAEHARESLLSAGELHFQLEGLAGPRRELPDLRFHELFEQRAAAHPDAVAAVHGDRQLTYRELNERANRLARALLARGLTREGVVAVVTERNLNWMAGVLAIFKAGGVYLPIEPHFPSERIRTMLVRSGCEVVLRQRGGYATLDRALDVLPNVRTLGFDDPDVRELAEADL